MSRSLGSGVVGRGEAWRRRGRAKERAETWGAHRTRDDATRTEAREGWRTRPSPFTRVDPGGVGLDG